MQPSYDAVLVTISLLIATFAAYVTLDLARRAHAGHGGFATQWKVGGAVVMGSGIWAMHFVGMLAMSLPIDLGYDGLVTLVSWVAAVTTSAIALDIATRPQLTRSLLACGALAMGGGICAMHYIGMAAIQLEPGIRWHWLLVAASALIACGAAAVALLVFFWMRRLSGAAARYAQFGASVVMGVAISGMHYTGMAAAGFDAGTICLSAGELKGHNVGVLVVVASAALLSIALFTSALDLRLSARAAELSASLSQANQHLLEANDQLRRLAFLDPLTGVANRALFDDRLRHALDRVERVNGGSATNGTTTAPAAGATRARLAILFIDVDGFKPVNDSYGHGVGDEVLVGVAQRLSGLLRNTDTLARIGGDEFVLLLEDLGDLADAIKVANRGLAAMARPFEIVGREVTLSCSIGLVVYPDQGQRGNLLANADAAMYSAKQRGGARFVVFDDQMSVDVAGQVELQEDLRHAPARGQLQLHYQPKIDCDSHAIHGVEALLRWDHPTRGRVSPLTFIPIAERFGLIDLLGRWVIDEACRQLAQWAREGLWLCVSINLSPHQLRQVDTVDCIRAAIRRHGIDADQLVCEITESAAMDVADETQQVLRALAETGVDLSIDDFGTGHSSLARLRLLRPHELKIDRSFVKDLPDSTDARVVVDAVIRLAHALGLRVVAEGVETRAQAELLCELGCDELQGYYFARPMAAAELTGRTLRTSDGAQAVEFARQTLSRPARAAQ